MTNSFWNTSDNSKIENSGSYEQESAELEPIPKDTGLVAAIEEAKWGDYEENSYISLKWRVLGGDYKNRVIFQKLYVMGDTNAKNSDEKADKAKRMLAAIDFNAGGMLQKVERVPEDEDLMRALVGKMMAIKVQVWTIKDSETGELKKGNWINAVSAYKRGEKKEAPIQTKAPTRQAAPKPQQQVAQDEFEDDIPF